MKGISVIIPVYNREHFIRESIQSVIDQDYQGEIEIIVSDDGSTDKTLEIVNTFGQRVKILQKEEYVDRGASRARNRAIKAATQDYIAFLDSDDYYLPGHLNRLVHLLESNNEIDYVFCRTLALKEENGRRLFRPWTHPNITKLNIKYTVISGENIVNTNSFVFRKKIFDRIGYFNEALSNSEDYDMWMRINEQFKGAFINSYGATYRVNHGNDQLTTVSNQNIHTCYREVNSAAIQRYYQQGLKDSYRIYSLKHARILLKYKNSTLLRYLKYLLLICRYPIAFIKWIPFYYDKLFRQHKQDEWQALSYFLNT